MKRARKTYITSLHDGHCMLVWERPGLLDSIWIRLLLQFKYGFRREGKRVVGGGEAFFPAYVRDSIRLFPEYDSLVGFTLRGQSNEADIFLKKFFSDHVRVMRKKI